LRGKILSQFDTEKHSANARITRKKATARLNMQPKVKLIKKADRDAIVPSLEPRATPDAKEWSTAVKSWVVEFQKDKEIDSLEAFDSLFAEPTT
jgi:hypothetical protein